MLFGYSVGRHIIYYVVLKQTSIVISKYYKAFFFKLFWKHQLKLEIKVKKKLLAKFNKDRFTHLPHRQKRFSNILMYLSLF